MRIQLSYLFVLVFSLVMVNCVPVIRVDEDTEITEFNQKSINVTFKNTNKYLKDTLVSPVLWLVDYKDPYRPDMIFIFDSTWRRDSVLACDGKLVLFCMYNCKTNGKYARVYDTLITCHDTVWTLKKVSYAIKE